ncbi:uncharacterized protein LOC131663616 isoform X2 [Phymastichus coffea]|uniref:uncharacterized protein LOC131663616 isoform X2 n=1 Tax=Phymastichus coffea TaxID=108790 RepID=UPI00273AA1ED|nr:uncharacterized protein LOC131663616 isoform X2 [Phymastichus coffea]
MTLNTDISTALHLLEHVHKRVEDCDDPKLQLHTSQDLQSLISLLEDPVFRSIVTMQDSLAELNTQLTQHPSILPGDFDIHLGGQLELIVPNTPVQPIGQAMYQNLYHDTSEIDDQRVPVAPLLHSSNEDTSAQVTSPSLNSEVMGIPPIMNTTYAKEFQKVIDTAARGRQIFTVQLFKSEGTSLGFSVVGLRSKDRGELGIFLQEIQPNGIAGSDGRLVEGDQILAIDGQPLDSNISHEQAISILQKARGLVELIVARSAQDVGSSLATDELSGVQGASAAGGGGAATGVSSIPATSSPEKEQSVSVSTSIKSSAAAPSQTAAAPATSATATSAAATQPQATTTNTVTATAAAGVIERSNSAVSDASKGGDMVLNTEWAQVEVINLINDGSGLGFGIIGGRSTGVVVKTILPGGVADRDNRLQSGDHILQIGDVNLRGMGSEQVAAVLRQSGTHVRLVVARPVEPTSPDYQALGSHAPIVPTKVLGDPEELDRYLLRSGADAYNQRREQGDFGELDTHGRSSLIIGAPGALPIGELPVISMEPIDVNALPEMEKFTVELKKDSCGLGITIAGYVCEKEELSGIFVKSISEGSAADLSKQIQINDRIVAVNGHSLQGYSNHEAVEVLRSTGLTVTLCLERYLRGPKYEQLQQAIAASELRPPPPGSPSIASLPTFPISADGDTTEIEPEGESHTTVDSAVLQEIDRDVLMDILDEVSNVEALLSDPSTELTPKIETAIKAQWQKIVGPDMEIVVAQLKKFAEGSGLGISLEGTVDVENGQEVRPHHYIRSILPEGPVGQNGILRSGDELLEVNGYRLLGINHMEVVSVLKELPIHVRMICGRNIAAQDPLCPIDTAQHQAAFQTRSILGGSLQNLLPSSDRLVKAKSDGSLASTTTTATVTDASLNKMKSRSLEPLTGLAMWSSEPQIIELVKGERGLGFSILDYQDPMNPNETVIVIRSLVPGGVAQVDGQLIPGDRLLFVNDIALENATLDQAVQALKGAPKGIVRIGVAKPLPIPDSIAQRLAPIGIVRRSKSLPDSDATDHGAAELLDFLSSRSGASDAAASAAVEEDGQSDGTLIDDKAKLELPLAITTASSSDNVLLGLEELLPRTKRKDDLEFEPHSPLIKLTPFPEEQRRAMVREDPLTAIDEDVLTPARPYSDAARLPDAAEAESTRPRRRKSTPTEQHEQPPSKVSSSSRKRSLGAVEESRRSELRRQESIDRVARYLESEEARQFTAAEDRLLEEAAATELDFVEFSPTTPSPPPPPPPPPPVVLLVSDEAVDKRRPSLRRRREDAAESVFKDGQDRSPVETVKKTVRICSVEEEIQIESFDSVDADESAFYPGIQEVQLVTAKILTAEELAESISKRDMPDKSLSMERKEEEEDESPGITRLAIERLTAEARLQPATIKPSASENALSGRAIDDKISEKNIKPEILMDLSRVSDELEEQQRQQRLLTDTGGKRRLSRVSSDSACPPPLPSSQVKFRLGGQTFSDEEPPSSRHSETDLVSVGLDDRIVTTLVYDSRTLVSTRERFDAGESIRREEADKLVLTGAEKRWTSYEDVCVVVGSTWPKLRRKWCSDSSPFAEGRSRQRQRQRRVVDRKEEPPPPAVVHKAVSPSVDDDRDRKRAAVAATSGHLISCEHSLTYQQQTLESSVSLEDLLGTEVEVSPAPELEVESLEYSSSQSLLSASYKSYESPKREIETQTEGENKSTQYEVEDLASYIDERYDSREELEILIEARFASPKREAEVQTEQECKAVQCRDEEFDEFASLFRRQASFGSPRRDVQVQTGQDSKQTQCYYREFGDEELVSWQEPPLPARIPAEQKVVECSSSRESSSPGSSSPKHLGPPLIVLVKGGARPDMTVTHRDKDGNVVWAKHWGPERLVEIYREHQTSLGLSIVGGKVDLQDSSSTDAQNVSGIFIKNVIPNSPAGRAGGLQTGDRIIEVDGEDLRNSTHERAVKAIQAAGNPVRLLVQSLVHLSPDEAPTQDRDASRRQSTRNRMPGSPTRHRSPEVIQEGRSDLKRQGTGDGAGPSGKRSSMKKSIRKKAPSPPGGSGTLRDVNEERGSDKTKSKPTAAATEAPKNKYSSGESSEEEEDTRDLEGNIFTKTGIEISRRSAANVKRSKAEIDADPEQEDEFGYTTNKVKKKYHYLKQPVHIVKIDRDRKGLGISLAGHKDRNKMAVYVCGLNPQGNAAKTGQLQYGDELLEVNGHVFQGRCHLNASSMIKGLAAATYTIVFVRNPMGADYCAVRPVAQFPTALAGEDYSMYKGVHTVPIKKGTYGLGIMIIEGKHAEVGQGIFVSDVQEGGAAEQAGLNVGDMILAVNADTVMGATYDEATALLKNAEGIVTLTVCNPNQKKVAEDEAKRARGEVVEDKPVKEEKKKEPDAPHDPKTSPPKENKDTVIEFPKEKDKPIGFSVVGGTDTPSNAVFILDVFPDGACGKDGRLQPGDRIVEINKVSFKAIDSEQAYQTVLRITQGPIIMTVHRGPLAFEEFEVELTKKAGKGSGLCLIGYKSGKGAYVSEVVPGGSAAESQKIVKGDRIVSVGGQDLRDAPVEDIALHVKVFNPVQLKLSRYRYSK